MNDKAQALADTDPNLVVVLLATFNGARYLQQQLDSIAAQSHRQWRLIICDDGSDDGTLAVIQKFSDRHPMRVRTIHDSPVGSARDNFFRLLRATGHAPYLAFCDQDDVWRLDKLECLVHRCQQLETQHQDQPCLVYSDLTLVDADLGILSPSFMGEVRARPDKITYKTLLVENAIPGCAMLFNAALADILRAREFDSSKAIMHDWWIALVALTIGHVSYVESPLVRYRQHATNTLGSVKRSGLRFVLSKLVFGDRSAALQTYAQGAAFLDAYGDLLHPALREDIRAFASLAYRKRTERIRLLVKHRILKQTFGRRAYQLLRA